MPQIFVPYKEVLDIYRKGMKLPGDVTLGWVDDNFGYIRQLSNAAEQQRPGAPGFTTTFLLGACPTITCGWKAPRPR